jgi:nucleoside-diphosphate-sugar epimerase
MKNQVFNVGSNKMNYTKADIARKIKEKIDYYLHFADVGKDEDQRNYEVSYEKIESLGFTTTTSLEKGIDELLGLVEAVDISNPYSNV